MWSAEKNVGPGVEKDSGRATGALGLEEGGSKHLLGLWQGATEIATVCTALLEDLVGRGLNPERRYPFMLDGSKALRAAVDKVCGGRAEVRTDGVYILSSRGDVLECIRFTNIKRARVLAHVSTLLEPPTALTGSVSPYYWGLRGKYYGFVDKGVIIEVQQVSDIVIGCDNPEYLSNATNQALISKSSAAN